MGVDAYANHDALAMAAFRQAESVLWIDVCGDAVLLDGRTGRVFGINSVGNTIWEFLAHGETFPGIVEGLCTHFEVDPQMACWDLRQFLSMMIELGLVVQQ